MACGCTDAGAMGKPCSCAGGKVISAPPLPQGLGAAVRSVRPHGASQDSGQHDCGSGAARPVPGRARMAPSGNLIPPPDPRPDRARWQRLVAGLPVAQDLDLPATERVFANAWNRPVAPPKGGRPKRAPLLGVPLASAPGTRGQVLRPAGAATPAAAKLRAAVSPAMLSNLVAAVGPGTGLDLGTWYPAGSAKCEDFVYRDVAFCIPTSFLTGYQSAAAEQLEDSGGARAFGPVSSTSETVSAL